MLQFNQQEIERIKKRSTPDIINELINDNRVILNSDTLVPPDARATWNLYYFCPDHAVRLDWQRDKPTEHRCPVDGKIFTGEPYDGAWWRGLNGLNAKACNDLGLLWQITKEQKYFDKVKTILLEYAKYYPDYEEHGGIPYNGPGKANAQTLCEANCHLDFAKGYDFIREALNAEEKHDIESHLLCEGADFLMQHRSDQLHNHEMKIGATIGVIGLIVNNEHYIDFALNSTYGLIYQLENGLNQEGFWFEGSIHYHYYALQALLAFEKIAHSTKYSVKTHPNYFKMLAFPLQLLTVTGDFPRLNDCIAGQEKLSHTHLFEFAYQQFNEPLFAQALNQIYQDAPRNNIDALLYGVDTLPDLAPISCHSIHAPLSGLTVMHDNLTDNMLLLKHSPFGGEHDHYDRLGLILYRNGQEILPDLGTTGYGAEIHYGYYKNTATHNTLAVNQKNQPPANPEVLNYQQQDQFTFISTKVDWLNEIENLDSHTIIQWDQESYNSIVFQRSILWLNDIAIEINQVENPNKQQLDLTWHVRGELSEASMEANQFLSIDNPFKGPLERMNACYQHDFHQYHQYVFAIPQSEDYSLHLYSSQNCQVITGLAPDNPATHELGYLLLRSQESRLNTLAIHDLTLNKSVKVQEVNWEHNLIQMVINRNNAIQNVHIDLDSFSITI